MEEKYLLSVLIPTKNREKYLRGSIEQILKIEDKRIQIVIQDNSDISIYEQIKEILKLNNNIKYNYTPGIVSFVENFDIGLQLCEGEYVCLIGDDDGIMPQIIPVIEWAKKNNKKIIKPSLNISYFWPESGARGNKIDDGCLKINNITQKIRIYDAKKELQKLIGQGCQDYLLLGTAKLYHGIVKKECLDKIKEKTGKYFGGLTPDIYMATALSLVADEIIEINFPLTVPGVCKGSGSSDSATGKHTGMLEEAPHFKGHKNYSWSELIPKFYSVETIWAESSVTALEECGEKELLEKFNLEFLTLSCLLKYPKYKEFIVKNYKNNFFKNSRKKIIIKNILHFNVYNIKKFFTKVRNKSLRILNVLVKKLKKEDSIYCELSNVKNISEAVEIINEKLNKENINIKKIIVDLEKITNKF
ncbi:MAG: glycosyltransferase family 2 protein [Cetobacterium sp.]